MLTLRKEQIDKLQAHREIEFIAFAQTHLYEQFPGFHEPASPEAERHVKRVIETAKSLGLADDPWLLRFLELSVTYGPDFGRRPEDAAPIRLMVAPEIAADWPATRRLIETYKDARHDS